MVSSIVIAERGDKNSPFPLIGDIIENIQKAAIYGFEGVELQLENPDRYMGRLKMTLDTCHIKVTSVATGLSCRDGLSMTSSSREVRKKTMERLKSYVELVSELGEGIVVHIGLIRGRREDGQQREQYLRYFEDGLDELADYAFKWREVIVVEPINHIDGNMLCTWKETAEFIERLSRPNIGISLDLYHMRMEETDIMKTLRLYGNWTRIIQLMDENRWYPGGGMLRFEPFVKWVKETGYDGPVVMECLPEPDCETAVNRWMNFYRQHFGG